MAPVSSPEIMDNLVNQVQGIRSFYHFLKKTIPAYPGEFNIYANNSNQFLFRYLDWKVYDKELYGSCLVSFNKEETSYIGLHGNKTREIIKMSLSLTAKGDVHKAGPKVIKQGAMFNDVMLTFIILYEEVHKSLKK